MFDKKNFNQDPNGVNPDLVTFNIIIEGLINSGNRDRVKEYFQEMKKRDLFPDESTLTILDNEPDLKNELELIFSVENTEI